MGSDKLKIKAQAKSSRQEKEVKCSDIMNKKVISVTPGESIVNAIELLQIKKIRHLPVIKNNKVVGILSDRDTKQVMAILQVMGITLEQARADLKVTEFMASPVRTINVKLSAVSAAKLLIKNKISCLPVVLNGKIVGILTETDIMQQFIKDHSKS